MFRVLAFTGMRIGEAVALRVGDVDLRNRRLIVQRAARRAGRDGGRHRRDPDRVRHLARACAVAPAQGSASAAAGGPRAPRPERGVAAGATRRARRPFPARKTLEEFDFAFQASLKRDTVLHLGQLDFLAGRENIVLLGPPGTGKTHLAIALAIRACLAGHRVAFRTATEWVAMLADVQRHGRLDAELDRLQRIPLLIVDEVGYIPFDPQATNLMFMRVSRRYERASLIVTSNKPFSAWGEIFGDEITAAAMIDRLVHHAILALKGDSYRLKDRDLARPATPAD